MASDDIESQVEEAARSFDAELHTKAFAETHSDAMQLAWMLSSLSPVSGQVILDLGTGNGYVATAITHEQPGCRVIGVDVAAQAIARIDAAISRYVFHHLPRPEISLAELGRTVRVNGRLVLADAIRHEADHVDFINHFQALKRDGHIRMHRRTDFINLVSRHGFDVVDTLESSISFSRERGPEYDALIAETPDTVLKTYSMQVEEQRMSLTFPILSVVFENLNASP
jgi:ubiquinone/menaquinone biosynthesis C-methylase UbiE